MHIDIVNFIRIQLLLLLVVLGIGNPVAGQGGDSPYMMSEVDRMPVFGSCADQDDQEVRNRCSNTNLAQYLSDNIKYPQQAKDLGIEGKVFIAFTVDSQGNIQDPQVLHDIGGGCGVHTIDLVKSMEKWQPAIKEGTPVTVRLTLPVLFDLDDAKSSGGSDIYSISLGRNTSDTITVEELRNLGKNGVVVRDAYGNTVIPDEVTFAYRRKRVYRQASCSGIIGDEVRNLFKKVKNGGRLMITAVVQTDGTFTFVKKLVTVAG